MAAVLRGTVFLAALLCAAIVHSDETKPIEIPLKDIWAWQMPGTKDVRDLEPDKFGDTTKKLPSEERFHLLEESLTQKIRNALEPTIPAKPGPHKSPEPKPAFVVIGDGAAALKAAYDVLVDKELPKTELPPDRDLTIVFFSYQAGSYVHIEKVQRSSNEIEISYHFVPHLTANVSEHFALIPMEKLPAGEYQVKLKQLPMDPTYLPAHVEKMNADWASRLICQPFSFFVK